MKTLLTRILHIPENCHERHKSIPAELTTPGWYWAGAGRQKANTFYGPFDTAAEVIKAAQNKWKPKTA